jgi:hypothetical protein
MLTAGLSNKALIKRQAAESSGHWPEGIRQPKGCKPYGLALDESAGRNDLDRIQLVLYE